MTQPPHFPSRCPFVLQQEIIVEIHFRFFLHACPSRPRSSSIPATPSPFSFCSSLAGPGHTPKSLFDGLRLNVRLVRGYHDTAESVLKVVTNALKQRYCFPDSYADPDRWVFIDANGDVTDSHLLDGFPFLPLMVEKVMDTSSGLYAVSCAVLFDHGPPEKEALNAWFMESAARNGYGFEYDLSEEALGWYGRMREEEIRLDAHSPTPYMAAHRRRHTTSITQSRHPSQTDFPSTYSPTLGLRNQAHLSGLDTPATRASTPPRSTPNALQKIEQLLRPLRKHPGVNSQDEPTAWEYLVEARQPAEDTVEDVGRRSEMRLFVDDDNEDGEALGPPNIVVKIGPLGRAVRVPYPAGHEGATTGNSHRLESKSSRKWSKRRQGCSASP